MECSGECKLNHGSRTKGTFSLGWEFWLLKTIVAESYIGNWAWCSQDVDWELRKWAQERVAGRSFQLCPWSQSSFAWIPGDLSPPWGPKCPKSSFVVLTKLFCFSKMFFWEKQSEDIFLLFRIPNLLGSIRIYSSLLLFIVVHMFMAFCKINGDNKEQRQLLRPLTNGKQWRRKISIRNEGVL